MIKTKQNKYQLNETRNNPETLYSIYEQHPI
jgi:hypothetical protein